MKRISSPSIGFLDTRYVLVDDRWLEPPADDWYDPTSGLPSNPDDGDRYIAEETANGWTQDYIYEWCDECDEWHEYPPEEGWMIWMLAEFIFYYFFSGGWMEVGTASFVNITGDTMTGDLLFAGSGSGLAYAEIYTIAASDTITIDGTGEANKAQITSFDTDGHSNNMTPSHASNHITVTKAGMYLCTVSLHVESAAAGGADIFGFSVFKNDGDTGFDNVHGHRKLAGGGIDVGSVTLSGIIDLAVDDTIELWCWNEDSTDNLVVQDVTMSLTMIGGTTAT